MISFQKASNWLELYKNKNEALNISLMDPNIISDHTRLKNISIESFKINNLVSLLSEYICKYSEFKELDELSEEFKELVAEEKVTLNSKLEELSEKIQMEMLPQDPYVGRSLLLEIRAGIGGEEAGLFAKDIYRMYERFCSLNNIKMELLSLSEGFKEIILLVSGRDAYQLLKFESGLHRVQRIPETESKGRLQTSVATVAVLPEPLEVEVKINDKDLKIDRMRAGGPGGQSVNTTDSAVRVVHIPTQTTVICRDEKSQHDNLEKAMKVLKARLLESLKKEANQKEALIRKSQVSDGGRGEYVRTYNFPQNRVTDHRINVSIYDIDGIMNGKLNDLINQLIQDEKLKQLIEV